jgi:AraC family transcriptional regulator of adaptative response/methylated-DNA-[protein]-cysteine methyltransferase
MRVIEKNQIALFYKALLERQPSFVGVFYVGVQTTSVFCIATCRARKPKLQNVTFYTTYQEAIDNGYRPCKICKPTENANQPPAQVDAAICLIEDTEQGKITDHHLRERGISPQVVRRWFNKNYGITFQAYQRMKRINGARQDLKHGRQVTATAFDAGYESLSGFGYTFKKIVGSSPQKYTNGCVILIDRITTPLGPMFAGATDKGLCLLEFVDRPTLEAELDELQRLLSAKIITGENVHLKQIRREITEYFEGTRRNFEVTLQTPGTSFQNSVWKALRQVAFGKTATYGQQAKAINRPRAFRAVASANATNRISIVIPCHRVIGQDGQLRGYGGGIERKRWLINHERKNAVR